MVTGILLNHSLLTFNFSLFTTLTPHYGILHLTYPSLMKILLAEDNGILANLYKSILEKAGHKVYTEPDGEQTLYRMRNWKPDLVLLDIKLPKKTGYEVLVERKDDPDLKKIPVIVLTGLDESETRRKAEELGADGYIHKVKLEIEPLMKKIGELVPEENTKD